MNPTDCNYGAVFVLFGGPFLGGIQQLEHSNIYFYLLSSIKKERDTDLE